MTLRDVRFWPTLKRKPRYLYHGTSSVRLPGIRIRGLVPFAMADRWRFSKSPAIHLAADRDTALYWAEHAAAHFGGDPIILRMRTDDPNWDVLLEHDPRVAPIRLDRVPAWMTLCPMARIPPRALEVCRPPPNARPWKPQKRWARCRPLTTRPASGRVGR